MPRASITTLMATETLYLHQVSGICQSNKTGGKIPAVSIKSMFSLMSPPSLIYYPKIIPNMEPRGGYK